jgi:diguanylate cyclase (GGDEF)-like protein
MLAFVPLITLGAYWAGGETALIVTAVLLPMALSWFGTFHERPRPGLDVDEATGLMLRDGLVDWVERAAPEARAKGLQAAVLVATIDDLDEIESRFGLSMRDAVLLEAAARLKRLLRDEDVLARLGEGFAIGIRNLREPETENLRMMADRLQAVFEEPFSEGPTRTYCSLSLGIAAECHVKRGTGANIVAGAQRASELAQSGRPGAVRIYNDGLSSEKALERDVARELASALETSEIFAWFQPQLRISDGRVIGFEALARWDHPERGLVSPTSFLPDIEKAGLSQRLAEVVLKQSLMSLNAWDAAGFDVPCVSVNFSTEELRNPKLPDYVRWELDRHDLEPKRLVIEVLESVASDSGEDAVSRTLLALSRLGCRIDLDDFGTGFTSFVNIRRFDVGRIKIDRSLVSDLDRDKDQYRMISALLAFARELGIAALAEGVETDNEVDALTKLGCSDMQGFVAARPMPLGETLLWLEENAAFPLEDRVRTACSAG